MHPRMIKKRIIYEKNVRQARFLMKIKCAAGKTYETKAPQARFLD